MDILKRIAEKKQILDNLQPLPASLVKNLWEWNKIALTYTSNGLEGNTLTHQETALLIEKGITIGGKSIVEHLEALNHDQAIDTIVNLSHKKRLEISLQDLLLIHKSILRRIDDEHAGILRTVSVRISGSMVVRPNYMKLSLLMDEFIAWLQNASGDICTIAADAHLKFVFIHPFTDGNGRTARLLLNLIMLQQGFPLVIIEKEDRLAYINGIEEALLHNRYEHYYACIYHAIEKSLDMYIQAAEESKKQLIYSSDLKGE